MDMTMNEYYITDRKDWKLKLKLGSCKSPENFKHITLCGEQYNDDGNLVNSSSYEFFLSDSEIINLSNLMLTKM